MYEELKEEIKLHEGFVPRVYKDSLGKKPLGMDTYVQNLNNGMMIKNIQKKNQKLSLKKILNEALKMLNI